jgi:hypothetical protein
VIYSQLGGDLPMGQATRMELQRDLLALLRRLVGVRERRIAAFHAFDEIGSVAQDGPSMAEICFIKAERTC